MCNPACLQFASSCLLEGEIKGKKVIEVGSLNVNGSVRCIIEDFKPLSYLGVDIINGPGVEEICDIDGLVNHFGKESFDVVISTETLEHVRNWRNAVSNLKNILKPNGTLFLTTRSKKFRFHAYPFDFWRYEVDDVKVIFSDLSIEVIERDPLSSGVFIKAHKPVSFFEKNLEVYDLYSIIRQRRCRNISEFDILFFRLGKWPVRRFLSRIMPIRARRHSLRNWF